MTIDIKEICILIPAFNEVLSIKKVVEEVSKYGSVIVIDDGSTDLTGQISKDFGAIVLKHQKNQGYDKALNTGFKKANELKYKYLVTIDADGQHSGVNIGEFIEKLENGFIFVNGVRKSFQRLSEYVFSFYTKKIHNISDPLCGLKAYNLNVYSELGFFDSYSSIGTELMLYCSMKKYKTWQININEKPRVGVSRFGNSILSNILIIRSLVIAVKNDLCYYIKNELP